MENSSLNKVDVAESLRILGEKIKAELPLIDQIRGEMEQVIIGQKKMIDRLLIGLLSNGHILLEGVPGLAKTLAIKTLSDTIGGDFSRIQFTPDLLPADVTGTLIYNQKNQSFSVNKGPVFANFVLADEINRAPAKVQSALLEAMQERQVTIGDETHQLPSPFLVLATQNPVEQEGTYPLPEAQVDRFMLKIFLDYPEKSEEQIILRNNVRKEGLNKANNVTNPKEILRLVELVREVYLDEKIEKYIVDIVFASRYTKDYRLEELSNYITFGASPRASINLALAGKAHAFLNGRAFVIPEDIRAIATDVLQHRIGLSFEAEADNIKPADLVSSILSKVEVP